MAKRRRRAAAADADEPPATTAMDKIAGALSLMAIKGLETEDAALKLDALGFTSHEVSAFLNVNENYARVAKHRAKKKTRARGE